MKPPRDICRQFTAICRHCQVATLKESSFRRKSLDFHRDPERLEGLVEGAGIQFLISAPQSRRGRKASAAQDGGAAQAEGDSSLMY